MVGCRVDNLRESKATVESRRELPSVMHALAYSETGKQFAVWSASAITIFDAETAQLLRSLRLTQRRYESLTHFMRFINKDNTLVAWAGGGAFETWDLTTARLRREHD